MLLEDQGCGATAAFFRVLDQFEPAHCVHRSGCGSSVRNIAQLSVIAMRTIRKMVVLVALLAFVTWSSTFSKPSAPTSFDKVHKRLENLAATLGPRRKAPVGGN